MNSILVWFRQDLRLADNPALHAAAATGARIVPVYLWSPEDEAGWTPGAASRWWLHESLQRLAQRLQEAGVKLGFHRGAAAQLLPRLAAASGCDAVYWNRRYEPAAQRTELQVKSVLQEAGLSVRSFKSALLAEPWEIANKTGEPYRVFTPYWRRFLESVEVGTPLPSPHELRAAPAAPKGLTLESLQLLPTRDWHASLAAQWQVGEDAARAALKTFTQQSLIQYAGTRDRPDLPGSSRLSPHLHFGEVSPRQVWTAVAKAGERLGLQDAPRGKFCAELIWREYAAHVLHHFPTLPDHSHHAAFDRLEWRNEPRAFAAWTRGRTGYDIVDAGMRQLWQTGWMHNRVRMITASFLVKNLLHRWQDGERWFWDTLVDADLANNAVNWQWIAASGPDAAPWFRIFNPQTQAEKFDPQGSYRKLWVPEAGTAKQIRPLVELAKSRQQALDAYKRLRGSATMAQDEGRDTETDT